MRFMPLQERTHSRAVGYRVILARVVKLLDYIFYRSTRYYDVVLGKREPEIPGFGLTFLVAAGMLVDLAVPVYLLGGTECWHYANYYVIAVLIVAFVFCILRYTKERYRNLKVVWDTEDPLVSRKRGWYLRVAAFVIIVLPTAVRILR